MEPIRTPLHDRSWCHTVAYLSPLLLHVAFAGLSPERAHERIAALGVPETTILNTLTDQQWEKLLATIKEAEGTLLGWTYSRKDRRLPSAIRDAL